MKEQLKNSFILILLLLLVFVFYKKKPVYTVLQNSDSKRKNEIVKIDSEILTKKPIEAKIKATKKTSDVLKQNIQESKEKGDTAKILKFQDDLINNNDTTIFLMDSLNNKNEKIINDLRSLIDDDSSKLDSLNIKIDKQDKKIKRKNKLIISLSSIVLILGTALYLK